LRTFNHTACPAYSIRRKKKKLNNNLFTSIPIAEVDVGVQFRRLDPDGLLEFGDTSGDIFGPSVQIDSGRTSAHTFPRK
jgi:hypothetical protein